MSRFCRFRILILTLLVPWTPRVAGADPRDAVVNQVSEITLHYDCGKADPFWEGMYGGGCGPQVQRLQFWTSLLRGSSGHCYGTDALWQMNTRQRPFGPSATGTTWGDCPWEDAYQWPGSTQVGIGKRILEKYEWWRFEPHPEWLTGAEEQDGSQINGVAAGIPSQLRVIYLARKRKCKLAGLEAGSQWNATFISPIDGREYPVASPIVPDADGAAAIPSGPINQDWVLVLQMQKSINQTAHIQE